MFINKTGKTSLQWAVDHNFIDIAKLLLAHGAVLNHRDMVRSALLRDGYVSVLSFTSSAVQEGNTALAYAHIPEMQEFLTSIGGVL